MKSFLICSSTLLPFPPLLLELDDAAEEDEEEGIEDDTVRTVAARSLGCSQAVATAAHANLDDDCAAYKER